jgi:hypothetical protein
VLLCSEENAEAIESATLLVSGNAICVIEDYPALMASKGAEDDLDVNLYPASCNFIDARVVHVQLLRSMLEDGESVSQRQLDSVLSCLVPPKKIENPAAYRCVALNPTKDIAALLSRPFGWSMMT